MTLDRIYLVGFMGAGKSSVGRILSKRLNWKFLDLDYEIERAEHQAIADIFQKGGEPHFRKLEHDHLVRLSRRPNVVVALGGGTFVDPENRELAESTGLTVWLKVSFASVVARVKIDGTRPMFKNREQVESLYRRREFVYPLAKVHIETDDRNPAAVAEDLLGVINNL